MTVDTTVVVPPGVCTVDILVTVAVTVEAPPLTFDITVVLEVVRKDS